MALAITVPVAVMADTSNVVTYSFAAFTPTANSLLLVFANAVTTVVQPTVAGGSLTWNPLINFISGASRSINCFYADVGASPVSTTIQVSFTGDAGTGCGGIVYQITGHNATNPFAQTNSVNAGSGANPSVTLSQNMNTNNGYIVFFTNGNNPPAATPPSSWTEDADTGYATPTGGVYAAHRINGETGNTVTVTAAASPYDLLFVEVNEASQGNAASRLMLLGVG